MRIIEILFLSVVVIFLITYLIRGRKNNTATIGKLPVQTVYRRSNGQLFYKITEKQHVKVRLDPRKNSWLGDGIVENFDPAEIVSRID